MERDLILPSADSHLFQAVFFYLPGTEEEAFEEDLPTLDAAITSTAAPPAEAKDAEQADVVSETAVAPGTRFALQRRVVQTVSQDEIVSRTTLELDLTISIDEIVDNGARRFGVHYDRVRYSGELAGETFDYDSKNAGTAMTALWMDSPVDSLTSFAR